MFKRVKEHFLRRENRRRMERLGQINTSRRGNSGQAILDMADHSRVLTIFLLLLVWVVCTLTLTLTAFDELKVKLVVGQSAPETVFARTAFSYVDTTATAAKIEEAVAQVPLSFTVSATDTESIMTRFNSFFADLAAYSPPSELSEGASAVENLLFAMEADRLAELRLIAGSDEIRMRLGALLANSLAQGVIGNAERREFRLGQPIRVIDIEKRDREPRSIEDILTPQRAGQTAAELLLREYPLGADTKSLTSELTGALALVIGESGNMHIDAERTDARRATARAAVKPVMINVAKGEPLINRLETVTEEAKQKVEAYSQHLLSSIETEVILRRVIGNAVGVLLLLLFVVIGLGAIKPEMLRNNRSAALLGVVVAVSVLLNYALMGAFTALSANFNIPQGYMQDILPVALPVVVVVATLGFDTALIISIFMASIGALMLDSGTDSSQFFRIILAYTATCILSAMAVRNVTNYRLYAMRIFMVVSIMLFVLDINNSVFTEYTLRGTINSAIFCLINGLLTAIAALILIFVFEIVFHVSTDMSMLLLCDINHPLLKDLQMRAPGTSFHCQTVATLAENAAKEIGARSVACRAGALFHDVGKIKKPEYFTENNIGTMNLHEDLSPAMSAIILRSHVEDGVELARQYRLPRLISDMIQRHHGSDVMRFFYAKALEQANGVPVLESQYRYPGPLPESKEEVIVAMADACEAACRSIKRPTAANIATMVNDVFRSRLDSGQLSHCRLTVAELATMKQSFIRTLTTMYHSRIAYPAQEKTTDENTVQVADKTPRDA